MDYKQGIETLIDRTERAQATYKSLQNMKRVIDSFCDDSRVRIVIENKGLNDVCSSMSECFVYDEFKTRVIAAVKENIVAEEKELEELLKEA